jgi:hypothetical protein
VAIPAGAGHAAVGSPVASGIGNGDLANSVAVGALTAVGPGMWVGLQGTFNAALWASINTSLATTNGSLSSTLGSGSGLAAGAGVNSVNVPPGTTIGHLSGTTATLALPTVQEAARLGPGATLVGVADTTWLLGATVTGPVAAGIPAGTTVTAILQPAIPSSPQSGIVQLSAAPTGPANFLYTFNFALSDQAIVTGTDTAALFTGAGVEYSGTVQLERSFDGGATAVVCNAGGGGQLAQYAAGTPVSFVVSEPEAGVCYRFNCIAYTSGTINYRLSQTSSAALAWGVPPS